MVGLTLSLLGPFQAEQNGTPHQKFRTNKVQALLIYLTVEGKTPVRRDALLGLLWPGLPRKSAQLNLRQTVFQLRKLIPELPSGVDQEMVPFVLSERQTVRVHPQAAYTLDAELFTQFLGEVQHHSHADLAACSFCQERLERAIALYRGDFLSDFYLADSNIFEEWSMVKRESYRRLVLDALETLTTMHLRQGNLLKAQANARRQIQIDDLREIGYQLLMESLARDGQRNAAVAQYEACRRRLADELGMAPTSRTTRLCEQIKAGELGLTPAQPGKIRGYELLDEIGTGSFGAVYRAYQPTVGREVAVKIILREFINRPDFIRRFEAEAHMVAQLEHPHIVPLYDYWREPDGAYLVMRFLRGGNLSRLLEMGPLDLDTAVIIVDQIAPALALAHRQNIIHRDLKPANILLDEEGNSYLSDFGIAKDLTAEKRLTEHGDVIGSPDYISPEQLMNEPVTPRTDIYSLGVVLYTMLVGQHPFAGTSRADLSRKHLNEPLPRICEQKTGLPLGVDDVIQQATAKSPDERYSDVMSLACAFREAIIQTGVADLPLTPAETRTTAMDTGLVNPYKGLRSFQEADSDHFFGRDSLIEQLLAGLITKSPDSPSYPPSPARFLAVVGPSGCGKSSVVKAGLIPALRQGALPGSENWFIVEMTPGTHPLEELEAALLHVAVDPPPSLIEPLQKDDRGLVRTVKRILPRDQDSKHPSELLLLVDQFEELFTLVDEEAVRVHFLDSLVAAVSDPRSRLRVIITLRADFYDRPLQHPGIGELLRHHTQVVLPLSVGELEEAICGPAQNVGVTPELGLIAAITADVKEQPGGLPLLQYALTELFERRDDHTMTGAAYDEIGGVSGALSRRAEELYSSLDQASQEAARQFFLRLVTLGEGVEDTRRRVLRSELTTMQIFDKRSEVLDKVIDSFGQYRLLSFDRDPLVRGPTVEVAHEALLHEWPRLRDWLDQSRDDVRRQRQLAAAAKEWIQAGREDGFLLRGSRLNQFSSWSSGARIALTDDEQAFLDASIQVREKRETEREARRQRELEIARQLAETEKARAEEQSQAAKRLRRRAMYLAGVLVVAVLSAIVAGLFGQQSRRNADLAATAAADAQAHQAIAEERARIASARQLAAAAITNLEVDPERSVLLALQAVNETYLVDSSIQKEAIEALHRSVQSVRSLLTIPVSAPQVYWAFFSPDETQLILCGKYQPETTWIYDAITGELLHTLNHAVPLAVDWDDHRLITGVVHRYTRNLDEYRIWDTNSWEVLSTVSVPMWRASPNWFAFDPDFTKIVRALSDGTTEVWDLETGEEIAQLGQAGRQPDWRAAFSPDGERVATGNMDGTATVWDLATGESLLTLSGHTERINGVAFSPDGALLGTVSSDGVAKIWDVTTTLDSSATLGEALVTLRSHTNELASIAFSQDGTLLATGGWDRTVKIWDVSASVSAKQGRELATLAGHAGNIRDIEFNADGTRVVTGSNDGTARVWDVSPYGSGEGLVFVNGLPGGPMRIVAIDLSPDGTRLAAANSDLAPKVWDANSGELQLTLSGHEAKVERIIFSPDGELIVTASADNTVRGWDSASGKELFKLSGQVCTPTVGEPCLCSIAFSPDGEFLINGDDNGRVKVFEIQDLLSMSTTSTLARHNFQGQKGAIYDVAFRPDGQMIAVVGCDKEILRWNAETTFYGPTIPAHEDTVYGVSYSPDGSRIVSSSADGTARVWDTESGEWLFTLSGHTASVHRAAFGPDGTTIATASYDGTVKLWDGTTGGELYTLYGHEDGVADVVFSLDGKRLFTASVDGTSRMFLLDIDELIDLAKSRVTRSLTDEECRQYLHLDQCPHPS